jgi:3-phenylpropionate/cinnamic acid dioxygenase small subunit
VSEDGDRLAIHELLALHGHLVDEGAFERLGELFTADVRYDVSAFGAGRLEGRDAIEAAGRALGDRNPVGHHVTNVLVSRLDGDRAQARSKGLGVMTDGTVGSVGYEDELRRTPEGWRIAERRVLPRTRPLHPSGR